MSSPTSHMVIREPEKYYSPPAFCAALRATLHSSHLPALDSLRAIAALLVIFYHFSIGRAIGHFGNLGVEIFFVISGFLITWLLLDEQDRLNTINLKQFYLRRSLRIFPAFYVYLLLCLGLLLLTGQQILWGSFLTAFGYVFNLYEGSGYLTENLVGHTWSLAVEEQFYLLWPLGFLLCRGNTERMMGALIAMIGLVWVYRAWLVLSVHPFTWYLYEFPHMRADQLMMGCLLAVLLKREARMERWQVLCGSPLFPVITLVLLGISTHLQANNSYTYIYLIGFAIDPLLAAILIVQLIWLHTRFPWQWLNWRSVQYLGKISYSLYLYHALLMPAAVHNILAQYLHRGSLVFAVKVGITILLASASFWLVEQPFLRLKKYLINK